MTNRQPRPTIAERTLLEQIKRIAAERNKIYLERDRLSDHASVLNEQIKALNLEMERVHKANRKVKSNVQV